jgi:Domain of unknown function (DUF1848)
MILSASRRTDIPAFYGHWFINRIRAGYVKVANPFNPNQVATVSLKPEDVDAFVFWSKNPEPFFAHLDELDNLGFRYYFQFTLNDYGPGLERRVPPIWDRIDTFCRLAERLGPKRVIWRYDPIILSNQTPVSFHQEKFGALVESLSGATERCMTSFLTRYRKTERRLGKIPKLELIPESESSPEAFELISWMNEKAREAGITLFSCAQPVDYTSAGAPPGACVDGILIRELWDLPVKMTKDTGQRTNCRCVPSKDIGSVDTCMHGCAYCYSTISDKVAAKRHQAHDPNGERL